MPVPDRNFTRQASALLARHLTAMGDAGIDRIWLRPGTKLEVVPAPEESPAMNAWRSLAARAAAAPEPRALGTLRETFVFGTGNPGARLMLVGEAPDMDVESTGSPYAGANGEMLGKIIATMGLDKEDVYFTNIVKYRPLIAGGDQGAENRRPSWEEITACLPMLHQEMELVQPEVIVALGTAALTGLTGNPAMKITGAKGKFTACLGIPVMASYHPDYLNNIKDVDKLRVEKRRFWEDMLLVMEKLGLPITARQRGFFK